MASFALTRQPARWGAFQTLRLGALVGLGALALYTLLFIAYAVTRSTLQIVGTLSLGTNVLGTIVANALSIGLAATSVACLLALIVAPLCAFTLLLASWVSRWLNPRSQPRRAALVGASVAALLFALLTSLILQGLGQFATSFWPEGFCFWLGIPGVFFVAAMAWANARLTSPLLGPQATA